MLPFVKEELHGATEEWEELRLCHFERERKIPMTAKKRDSSAATLCQNDRWTKLAALITGTQTPVSSTPPPCGQRGGGVRKTFSLQGLFVN